MFAFKYKRNERKMPNFLIVVIILLMVMQIIVTNRTVSRQRIEEMTDRVFRVSDKMIADDENRYKSIVNLMATVYSDPEILSVLKRDGLSDTELAQVSAKMRKYASVAGDIDNIYYYESRKNVFYDMMGYKYKGEDLRFADIVNELEKDKDERKVFITTDTNSLLNQAFYYLFTPDPSERDAIIIFPNEMDIRNSFDEVQKMLASEIYVALDDGTVVYGGGKYRVLENISKEDFFGQRKNNKTYADKKTNDFIYCYFQEERMNKWYIVAIPLKNINGNNILNINYVYLYLGIIISLASLIYIFIFRVRFIRMLKEYAGKSNMRREEDETALRLRKKLLDSMYDPQSGEREEIGEYILSKAGNDGHIAFIFAQIDRFDSFKKDNRPSDTELFKYGIKNIMTELISKCDADVQDIAGQQDSIEFLVITRNKEKFQTEIPHKLSECINEVRKYIGEDVSFFVSDCFAPENIAKGYFQAENIRSYKYLYGNGCILFSDCIREENNVKMLQVREKCKEFCRDLYKDDADEENKRLEELFDEICLMNSMQAREIVWFLGININMKQNSMNIVPSENDNIGNIIDDIRSAKTISEIKQKAKENIAAVRRVMEYNAKHRFDSIVYKCDNIIEAEYRDYNLSIDTIAERLSLSTNYLGRNYKNQTGRSISETITDRRLSEIAKMLRSTDKEVKTAAAECGLMTNSSYLASIFKKRYGMTPIEYRKKYRTENRQ